MVRKIDKQCGAVAAECRPLAIPKPIWIRDDLNGSQATLDEVARSWKSWLRTASKASHCHQARVVGHSVRVGAFVG